MSYGKRNHRINVNFCLFEKALKKKKRERESKVGIFPQYLFNNKISRKYCTNDLALSNLLNKYHRDYIINHFSINSFV